MAAATQAVLSRWTPSRNGRFSFSFSSSTAPTAVYRHPGGLQILADGLPSCPGLALNAPQRPAQPAERHHLLLTVSVQDVPHGDAGVALTAYAQLVGGLG
jgi:hypothetical protein